MKLSLNALFVEDVASSKRFYAEVLGQEILMDNGAHVAFVGGFSIWQRGFALGTIFGASREKKGSQEFELCFESENLEGDFERVKDSGATIIHPIIAQPWGQLVFRALDPDSHIIEVAESLSTTIQRFLDAGDTLEEVSAKTHIDMETLEKFHFNV